MSTIIVTHELVPSQTWFLHREFSPSTRVQAAIVNMLRPGAARKFSDYANQVFIPYILSQSTDCMSCGMIIIRLKPAAREEREFVDMLSPVMPLPKSGRSFSA